MIDHLDGHAAVAADPRIEPPRRRRASLARSQDHLKQTAPRDGRPEADGRVAEADQPPAEVGCSRPWPASSTACLRVDTARMVEYGAGVGQAGKVAGSGQATGGGTTDVGAS